MRWSVPVRLTGLVLAGLGALVLLAPPAAAAIVVEPGLQTEYAGCVAQFRGSGNGAIVDALQRSPKVIKVRTPIFGSESDTTTFIPGSDVQINWVPSNDGRKLPGEGPGFTEDQCATLIHEMAHAADYADGVQRDTHFCLKNGRPISAVDASEVHASQVENAYRRAVELPVRTKYTGRPLPANGQDCDLPRPDTPRGGCSVSAVGANYLAVPSGVPTAGAGCANTNGDPHLTTFDGLRYDFQAAGEFVLAQGGDLDVQIRQTMYPGSSTVAVNTAVAADIAGDRVGVYSTSDGLAVRVNGAPLADPGARLPRGGTIGTATDDGSVTLTWPDGTDLDARPIGPWGLSVSLGVPEARRGTLTGLLGDDDGNPADDLVVRGGPALPAASFDALYPRFSDSWRIDPARSLFDYGPGESDATFTDRRFPVRATTVADLPNRATAELLCRQAGVTDPASLAACTLDVGSTGQVAFAADAARAQRSTSGAPGGSLLEVTRPGDTASLPVPGVAGQTLFVEASASTLPDRCGVLLLLDPAGTVVASGCIIGGTGFIDATRLLSTGPYRVVLDPTDADTGRASVRVVTVTDQQAAAVPDGPAVTATISQPGAVGRVTFPAAAGQKVFVDVPRSTLPDFCGQLRLLDPQGGTAASGCVISGRGFVDGTVLPSAGIYTLLVDPQAAVTGTADVAVRTATDQDVTAPADGTPVVLTVARPGAVARLHFTAGAGQRVAVVGSGSTLPTQCGVLTLLDPAGAPITTGCLIDGDGGIDPTVLPADGDYTVVVDPDAAATGTTTLTLQR